VLGRWLQQRITAANRDRLLASEGAAGLRCQRVCSGRPVLGPASAIATDDTLLVAPGELVCVDAVLQSPGASFSLDWVNGESLPRHFACGDTVPAGAFLCGASAVFLRATQPFTDSALEPLLRTPPRAESDERHAGPQASPLARRVARLYVPAVLLAALAGLVAWWWHAGDLDTGLAVATAVLVVTCPCAFGIATPLAHELVQAGLRRAGLFLCSNGFLDRAAGVRRVVFDKTGTLTTGALELTAPELLNALTPAERAALWDLAARSSHPASLAVRTALEPSGRQLRPGVTTGEVGGHGVETRIAGHGYRLGARCWATGSGGRELVFAVDGHLRLILPTRERIRPDAAAELAALRRAGHELWILSGDAQGRVDALAGRLGISGDRALGERSPQGKAAWLAATDRGDTLFIGDGVNDSLGCEQAHCSGTPAIDRPFLPARSDFYFVTPGLAPVALALRAARHLARVVRRNLVIAIGYNAAAVSLAWAGLMKPWLAAILMPSSSILVVLTTVMSLSPRSALWKS
jgi:Cu2+-exporting ATPase